MSANTTASLPEDVRQLAVRHLLARLEDYPIESREAVLTAMLKVIEKLPVDPPSPPLEFRINQPSGFLCTVSVEAKAKLPDLQSAIEASTGIAARSQRLVHGLHELTSRGDLSTLHPDGSEAAHVELLLLQRTAEQTAWHQQLHDLNPWKVNEWLSAAPQQAAREDKDFMTTCMRTCGIHIMQYAAPVLRADRDYILAIVAESGSVLEYATLELQADPDVVATAMLSDGASLRYACAELKELVLTTLANLVLPAPGARVAAHREPSLFPETGEYDNIDRAFLITTMSENPNALRNMSLETRMLCIAPLLARQ